MSTAELIVPMIVSAGALTLMLKSFVLFRASARGREGQALIPVPVIREGACEPVSAGTALHRSSSPDPATANDTIERARRAIAKYREIDVAIADGYRFPLGGGNQPIAQLTNHWYAFKAAFGFDAEHPASLLYEKTGEHGYILIGAVFTAPARFALEQLEARIPSSVAQWHKHELFGWAAEVYPFKEADGASNAAWCPVSEVRL